MLLEKGMCMHIRMYVCYVYHAGKSGVHSTYVLYRSDYVNECRMNAGQKSCMHEHMYAFMSICIPVM
jgi:hypothetical protein